MASSDKQNDRSVPHRRLVIPGRGGDGPLQPPVASSEPAPRGRHKTPAELNDDRVNYGFDDIPTDDISTDVSFTSILGAWVRQAIRHSPLEEKHRSLKQLNSKRKERIDSLKKDVKWALQADLDEPVKPVRKKYEPKRPVPTTTPDSSKTIDININFGSLPKLPSIPRKNPLPAMVTRLRGVRWTRTRIILGTVVVAVAIVGISWRFIPGIPGGAKASPGITSTENSSQSPNYATLMPGNKSIDSLGGWHRISPPDKMPVFAYLDSIDGVTISVSQQPIPDNFQPDIDKSVADLAKSYVATDKVTAGSTSLYIGTSAQGPQSAILAKNNVLILIKSQQKIADDSWASYVNSLN